MEPVEMTIAAIAAGAAIPGAVQATTSQVGGSTGVNVASTHVQYPAQFPEGQFADQRQNFDHDIIKFKASGAIYDNNLAVGVSGYISNDRSELVGRPHSDHPGIPINRFLLLNFDKSPNSEDMSEGLLTVNIEPWGGIGREGTADDPWLELHVHGRFDPVGPGDVEYGFKLGINTFGEIRLSDDHITGTIPVEAFIRNEGDHILVYLN